jgi:thiol-disulfide isomerase/thioredoxin
MGETGDNQLLFDAGILTARNGTVTTAGEFESAVEEYVPEIADRSYESLTDRIADRVDRPDVAKTFAELGADEPRILAELFALHDRLDPAASNDWLTLLPVLRLFEPRGMPTDGVPESFVPVSAEHVPQFTRIYSPAIVYIWLDDCPPCETVKADLESIFAEPQGVMPFAVYGPDHKTFLREKYSVTAGPALLFVRDGGVDARLYGAQPKETVESELEKLLA